MNFLGKLKLHLQGSYLKKVTKTPTGNHVKLFLSKHLKNTMLTSVKIMQMQSRKNRQWGALFSLVNLLRELLFRIQLFYIRIFILSLFLPIILNCSVVIKVCLLLFLLCNDAELVSYNDIIG